MLGGCLVLLIISSFVFYDSFGMKEYLVLIFKSKFKIK